MSNKLFDQNKFERHLKSTLRSISVQQLAMTDNAYNSLTNDAKFLITKMYEEYIIRRKNNESKLDATSFQDVTTVHQVLMPEWKEEDILYTCLELKSHGYISAISNFDGLVDIKLTTEAIAKSEQKFKDNLDNVLDYAAKIKSLIPFV